MIAVATLLLGALLFTLYVHAFRADLRGDDKEAYRRLAWTTPPWFAVTLLNAVQADVLFVVINIGMTMSGVWAYAEYRMWREERAEPEPERVDVLDSNGGEQ